MRLAMASGTWLVRSLTSLGDGPMEKIETASLGRTTSIQKLGGRLLLELEARTGAARDIEQQGEVYGRFPRFS